MKVRWSISSHNLMRRCNRALAFSQVVSDGAEAIQTGAIAVADAAGDTASRQALRDEIESQRGKLLLVDPGLCWLSSYLAYWESLALLDAAMTLDYADAGPVIRLATDRITSFNADELYACSGMTPP